MGVLELKISTLRDNASLKQAFETPGGKHEITNRITNFLTSVQAGNELAGGVGSPPSIAISIQGNGTRASGTLTLTTVIAANNFGINGVAFTGVASGATANQFNIGVSDTLTAVNIAAAVNASVSALVQGYVTATSAANVVTISSVFYSVSGNQTLLSSASGTIVASGAKLTGGAADASAQTLSF